MVSLDFCKNHVWEKPPRYEPGEGYTKLVEARKRLLLVTDDNNEQKPRLMCTDPLSEVNRQLRAEFQHYLHAASVSNATVARVRNFDFHNVLQFLSVPNEKPLNDFKLQSNGQFTRRLTVELHGFYTKSCMENLESWIDYINLLLGTDNTAELAIFYENVKLRTTTTTATGRLLR